MAVKVGKKKPESPPQVVGGEGNDMEEFDFEGMEAESREAGGFQEVKPEEIVKKGYPPFPVKSVKQEQQNLFWDWCTSLTADDMEQLTVYVYRTWPYIDRKLSNPNNPNYIDVIGDKEGLSKDSFLKRYGEGDYRLIVNDVEKSNKKGEQIGTAHISLRNPDYPPNIVLSELMVGHRSNRAFEDRLKAMGKLDNEGKIIVNGTGPGSTANDPALMGIVTNLISELTKRGQPQQGGDRSAEAISQMFQKTHEQTITMLKDQMKSDDPEKWIKIVSLLLPLFNKPDNTHQMLELLTKTQNESKARETELLGKMLEMVSAKAQPTDDFDKQLDRMVKMRELFGGGDGDGRQVKKHWSETLIEASAPIVGKVLDGVLAVMNMKNYQAGLAMQQQQQRQQPVQAEGPVAIPAASVPEGAGEGAEVNQFAIMLKQYGGLILGAMQRGEDGASFAASLEGMFGSLVYDQIAQMGKDGIITQMKSVPEFWGQVAGIEPTVDKFVTEFVAYGVEEGGENV